MEMLCQLSYNGLCLVLPATSSGTEQVVIGVIRLFSSLRLARFDDFEEDLFITINGAGSKSAFLG